MGPTSNYLASVSCTCHKSRFCYLVRKSFTFTLPAILSCVYYRSKIKYVVTLVKRKNSALSIRSTKGTIPY